MDRNEIILESQKLDYKLVNGINKMELFKGIEKFNDNNLSLTDFELYKIDEITYEEEEKAPRREAFENVVGTLRDSYANFLYIILGDGEKVSIYFGLAKNSYINEENEILELNGMGSLILKPSIEGNFRGSKIKRINKEEKEKILNDIRNINTNKYAYFEGIPGINETEDRNDFQGIDRLIDVMIMGNKGKFGLVVYANPIQKEDISEIEKDIYEYYNQYNILHKSSFQLGTNASTNSSKTTGTTTGTNKSDTKGTSKSETEGNSITKGTNKGTNKSEAEANNSSDAHSEDNSVCESDRNNNSKTKRLGKTETYGKTKTKTVGSNTGESESKGTSYSKTTGSSESKTTGSSTSESTSLSEGENTGTSETHNIEVIKKEIHSWITYIDETLLPMIDYGKSKGLFRVNTFIFAENNGVLLKLGNTLKSLASGKKGNKRPLEYYRLDSEKDQNLIDNLVNFQINSSKENVEKDSFLTVNSIENKDNFINDFYSVKELSLIAGVPRKEVNGLKVTKQVEFGLNTVSDEEIREMNKVKENYIPLELGNLVQSGNELENTKISINKKDLNKHIFVAGVTGTGKTTTCQKILLESEMPFLVIEPAKTEYRIMRKNEKTKDILIFTLGQDRIAPFRLNPFEFFEHESLTSRVDMIKAAIEASFDMEAAIPQLIESAIYKCYGDFGWEVSTNKNNKFENPFADGVYSFPTFSDVMKKVEIVCEEQGFDDRLKRDYLGSIRARLQSLTLGSKGLMLNTPRSVDFVDLLDKKVVLEIEEVKNTNEKSFVMGLIMINLREALRAKYIKDKKFKHITLVEEAHRLLSKYEAGDPINKKQGVEIFADMLAEVRKYGESLIIADQIPNKLTPEVLKNTNTKIIHKLFAEDDKESVGNTMVLEKEQKGFLSNLQTGRAIVFSQGWSKAVQVQIKLLTDTTSEEEIDENELIESNLEYYRKNYKKEIFFGSSLFDREPTKEELIEIIEFNKIGILNSFIDMYEYLMDRRCNGETKKILLKKYKNYKYKYEKLSNFNITLLIKLLDKFYFTDSPFIAEEKEKYITEVINLEIDEGIVKERWENMNQNFKEKLGKRGE